MPAVVRDDVIFVHVPKSGGTSIGTWLGGTQFIGHPTLETLKEHAEDRDQFTFAVVRNPWDRAVSGWHYLFHKPDKETIFQTYIDKGTPTFEEFVTSLETVRTDDVWFTGATPQCAWFRSGIDAVLNFHNLENEFGAVQRGLGDLRPLPHLNASSHKHYRTYFTPETRAIIADLFEEDIRTFGFTF